MKKSASIALLLFLTVAFRSAEARVSTYGPGVTAGSIQSSLSTMSVDAYSVLGNTSSASAAPTFTQNPKVNTIDLQTSSSMIKCAGTACIFRPAGDATSWAFGTSSLTSQTATDLSNLAIGDTSLATVATGAGNTGVGYRALRYTTGSNNIGVGFQAGYGISSGTGNVVVGHMGMQSLATARMTATGNTGIGERVGYYLQGAAAYNTLAGKNAGYYVTTGSYNTGLGYQALSSATPNNLTGSYNTAVGYGSLRSVLTTAASNTALGYLSGSSITTGSNNVIIGPNVASTTLTTGSSNILIGTSSAVDATASGASNTLNIGGVITGVGLDGASTSVITVPGNLTVTNTATVGTLASTNLTATTATITTATIPTLTVGTALTANCTTKILSLNNTVYSVTATGSDNYLSGYVFPANTFKAGDVLSVRATFGATATGETAVYKLLWNTATSATGGTAIWSQSTTTGMSMAYDGGLIMGTATQFSLHGTGVGAFSNSTSALASAALAYNAETAISVVVDKNGGTATINLYNLTLERKRCE